MEKASKTEHSSAADLLSDWRSAERDTIAARTAAEVAAAMDAAVRARAAAEQAKRAATHASEGSQATTATAEGAEAQAGQAVDDAELAEADARDRFHAAQADGFPKNSP